MFRPPELFLGLRMLRTPQPNRLLSLVSICGFSALAIGVTVLIVVLSVMNGFHNTLRERILAELPHITITAAEARTESPDWRQRSERLRGRTELLSLQPYTATDALLAGPYGALAVSLRGVVPPPPPAADSEQSEFTALAALQPGAWGIVLNSELAALLAAGVGERVEIILPEALSSPFGLIPRRRAMTVVGIIPIGTRAGAEVALIHLADANRLLRRAHDEPMGYELQLREPLEAAAVAQRLRTQLGDCCEVHSWEQQHAALFGAIRMEKRMISLLLCFIVLIAVFNLVSILQITIDSKRLTAAMLITMGANHGFLNRVFGIHGLVPALGGILAGAVAGVALVLVLPEVIIFFEDLSGLYIYDPAVYYVRGLPAELQPGDLLLVVILALTLSLIALQLALRRVARISPTLILRND